MYSVSPGSKVVTVVNCLCDTHSWPLRKEDETGLEKSIFVLLEKGNVLNCIHRDIQLEHILLEPEIATVREMGWLKAPTAQLSSQYRGMQQAFAIRSKDCGINIYPK